MEVREKAEFLQEKVPTIFEPRNKEETGDLEREFIKYNHKYSGLAIPYLARNKHRFDSQLVIIDKSLSLA